MKEFLGGLTIVMALVGYIPYLRDTVAGKTKPHVISWFLWGLVSFIAFGLQWSKGAGPGSWANLTMSVICFVLFVLSLKNGTKQIKVADVVSLILAIVAIVLWLGVNQPVWSIVLVVLIDIFSFVPTFIKSWDNPHQETLSTWILTVVRQGLILLSLNKINVVTALFPVYALTANVIFCALLVYRRRVSVGGKVD